MSTLRSRSRCTTTPSWDYCERVNTWENRERLTFRIQNWTSRLFVFLCTARRMERSFTTSPDIKRKKKLSMLGMWGWKTRKIYFFNIAFLCALLLHSHSRSHSGNVWYPESWLHRVGSLFAHSSRALALEAYSIYYNSYHIVVVVTRNPNVDSILDCCCCSPYFIWKQ